MDMARESSYYTERSYYSKEMHFNDDKFDLII